MGNNAEIRQRLETYRTILLVLNWVGSIALLILGFVLANSRYTRGIGIGVIIGSPIIGIIGHFFVNVVLAIPFILLNNGDTLESLKGKLGSAITTPVENTKKCPFCAEKIKIEAKICPHCGKNIEEYEIEEKSGNEFKENIGNSLNENKEAEIEQLKKAFDSSLDENEKAIIAKKLYDLGQLYYWRFIPKDKK